MNACVPVLIVTGPVGAGKTSVSAAISELLDAAGTVHALVDIDGLNRFFPQPQHDRFATELATKNLAAVWKNFQAAGATCLILAVVIESHTDLDRYRSAVNDAEILLVRLRAPLHILSRRLKVRESGASLEWHLRRAGELAEQMHSSALEDLLIDTEEKSVAEVAREILDRSRWPAQ
jgi:adenylylsulfate kinase-like enzyme